MLFQSTVTDMATEKNLRLGETDLMQKDALNELLKVLCFFDENIYYYYYYYYYYSSSSSSLDRQLTSTIS
jgi:hypothetical protein